MHNLLNYIARPPLLGIMLGLALLSGCGDGLPDVDAIDTPEQFLEGFKACADKVVATLDKIDDMDSFEANKDDLTAAYTRMLDLAAKAQEMEDDLSGDNGTELEADFREYNESLTQRMAGIGERHNNNPELAKAISDHINEITENHPFMKEQRAQAQREFDQLYQQHMSDLNRPTGTGTLQPEPAGSNPSPESYPADPIQPVTIIVEDVPTAAQQASVQRELTRIAQGKPVAPVSYQNRTATFTVALVVDPAAFANQLTFGQVRSVDVATRTITVRYNQ